MAIKSRLSRLGNGIRIVNKYKHTPTKHDVYCGRGSVFGNPFTHVYSMFKDIIKVDTRDEACDSYELYLREAYKTNPEFKAGIEELVSHYNQHKTVNLVCFCAPQRCHTESIKELVLEITKERNE